MSYDFTSKFKKTRRLDAVFTGNNEAHRIVNKHLHLLYEHLNFQSLAHTNTKALQNKHHATKLLHHGTALSTIISHFL